MRSSSARPAAHALARQPQLHASSDGLCAGRSSTTTRPPQIHAPLRPHPTPRARAVEHRAGSFRDASAPATSTRTAQTGLLTSRRLRRPSNRGGGATTGRTP
nr:unnamed protein product [Digitaria exilis]